MIDKWAKVKTVIDILVDEVLLHAITLLILVDALESESLASTSFVGVSFVVDIHNAYWSSINVSGDCE